MMSRKLTRALSMPLARPLIPDPCFVAASAPSEELATWDAASAASVISLDGTGLIATTSGNGTWATVRGNIPRSAGKANVEFQFPGSENDTLQFIGICNSSAGREGVFVGYDADGWGVFASDGSKWTNLSSSAFGAAWNTDLMQMEVDFEAKSAAVYKGASLLGTLDFSSIAGPYYFAGSVYILNRTIVANAGQSPMSRSASVGYPGNWGPDA